MKFFYVRRLVDGAVLDIPEKDVQTTLNRGGFEMIGEVGLQQAVETPVVSKAEQFECILCGFIGKNAKALTMHKTKKH